MALIRIKEKFQVTLPASLRKLTKVAVGDFLEADVERGVIRLRAKQLVNRKR